VGFYVSARGRSSPKEALMKVLTLPTAYAFTLGLVLRAFDVQTGAAAADVLAAVRATYTVLGMMMLGLALGDLRSYRLDARFVGFALGVKFLAWPLFVAALIAVDASVLHLFDRLARQGLAVAALLPMAANTVAIATLHDAEPEKASLAVLTSTLIAVALFPVLGHFVLAMP
jgi:predicted permease